MATAPIQVVSHLPERRRRPAVTTLHCGCSCCCCCCCLHTLGSIVGAAVAPAIGPGARLPITYYFDEEAQSNVPSVRKPRFPAILAFWWIFLALCVLMPPVGTLLFASDSPATGLIVSVVVLLLAAPFLQIISAVIVIIILACIPSTGKYYQIVQLGKIALGVVVGSAIGLLVMFLIGLALTGASSIR